MKLTHTDTKFAAVILAGVGLAFIINRIEGSISPLFISLVLGIILANSLGWPAAGNSVAQFAAKRALRLGVVLLGFQISISSFTEVGPRGLLAVVLIVATVFIGVRLAASRAGLSSSLGTLIAGGFAICGATAIAAISATRKFEQRDVSYAVAIVTLCGTLSIFIIPIISNLLGMDESSTGAWVGAAVHDVGQVIATASLLGPAALDSAIIVKLTRVVLLVPLILILARGNSDSRSIRGSAPAFVLAFVLCALLVNLFALPEAIINLGKEAAKVALAIGLFGMGLSVRWSEIRALGSRPLLFGIGSWLICGAFTLAVVRLVGF